MEEKLTYIEKSMKGIMSMMPEYYDHILSGRELSEFVFMLMERFSGSADTAAVRRESDELISGDFFRNSVQDLIANRAGTSERSAFRETFEEQTEQDFMDTDYDISLSRLIRYMPAQWHYSSYFLIYFPGDGPCDVYFRDGEHLELKKGELLILSPYTEHATPCLRDDSFLEYFLIRSSSFNKVFLEQLRDTSIMSHFFRTALRGNEEGPSYLLFDTGNDEEIWLLIDRLKLEIREKLPYSSAIINALMQALFSLTLRKYEDTAVLPSMHSTKWKKDFSRVFSYIENNFASASIKDVAGECGYSTRQIGRIVRNYFNMSYTELVTFLKMDKAVLMLREKAMSMKEISSSLGYSDLPSFYRAFRKYYGEAPAQYIKTNAG